MMPHANTTLTRHLIILATVSLAMKVSIVNMTNVRAYHIETSASIIQLVINFIILDIITVHVRKVSQVK